MNFASPRSPGRRALAAGAALSLVGVAFGGVSAAADQADHTLEEIKSQVAPQERASVRPERSPEEQTKILGEIAAAAADEIPAARAFSEAAKSGAVSATAAEHSFEYSYLLSGLNRFETMVFASWFTFLGDQDDDGVIDADEDAAPVVYMVNGQNFPDALSAAAPAAYNGGVLLGTKADSLPDSTRYELERLQPEKVVLVGGTSAISAAVGNQIGNLTGATMERQGGANRYETSRNVAAHGYPDGLGSQFTYIASGVNYPDALAAGAPAALFGVPVVLVDGRQSSVDAATVALFDDLGVAGAEIAGGTVSVSAGIEADLKSRYGAEYVVRSGGATRYETAALLVEGSQGLLYDLTREDADPNNDWEIYDAYFASGRNFPDALAGGALAGYWSEPFYPVNERCGAASAVQDSLSHLRPEGGIFLGGPMEEMEWEVFSSGTLPTC